MEAAVPIVFAAQMAYARPIMEALVRRPFVRRLRFTGPSEVVAERPPRHEDAVP